MLLTVPQFIIICLCLTVLAASGTYWIMMKFFEATREDERYDPHPD